MSSIKESICRICGKKFFYRQKPKGRAPFFCSDECRKRAKSIRSVNYLRKRYHSDPEFRQRRIQSNVASNTKKREFAKELELKSIAENLAKNRKNWYKFGK